MPYAKECVIMQNARSPYLPKDPKVLPHLLLIVLVEGERRLIIQGVDVLPRKAWNSPPERISPNGDNSGALLLVREERDAL
jgi:hypothetical protein